MFQGRRMMPGGRPWSGPFRVSCRCRYSGLGQRSCCGGECDREPFWGFKRRFVNRAERIAKLEKYLSKLEAEAEGVRESISALKGHPGGNGP